MRRLLRTALCACAFASAEGAAAADLPEVLERGVLRVIVAADEAPETFAMGTEPNPGFERELLEGFARLHRLKLEAVKAPGYAERIPMLQNGEGDVVAAIFDTPDRRQLADFTAEVMPTRNVVVTMDPRAPVRDLQTLKTLKVGVIRGAKPAEEAVQAGMPPARLVRFERREELLAALDRGSVEAAILPVSEMAVSDRQFRRLRAGMTIGPAGRIAWAVRKGDAALAKELSAYLENMRRGAAWNRLVVKYFGDQALEVLGR